LHGLRYCIAALSLECSHNAVVAVALLTGRPAHRSRFALLFGRVANDQFKLAADEKLPNARTVLFSKAQ
jgi:hypothetical protein